MLFRSGCVVFVPEYRDRIDPFWIAERIITFQTYQANYTLSLVDSSCFTRNNQLETRSFRLCHARFFKNVKIDLGQAGDGEPGARESGESSSKTASYLPHIQNLLL